MSIAVQPSETHQTEFKDQNTTVSNYVGDMFKDDEGPQAYLVDVGLPHIEVHPHFHRTDQFQVVLSDGFRMGKHDVEPVGIHYTDSFTPYGPLVGSEDGFVMFTLRAYAESEAFDMPESRDKLIQRARRGLTVPSGMREGEPKRITDSELSQPLASQEDGVAAYTIRVAPGATVEGPDPSSGGGQYYVVVNGSWEHGATTLGARSLVWVAPTEPALRVQAGPDGAEVLVVQFSRDTRPIPVGGPSGQAYRDQLTGEDGVVGGV